MTTPAGWYPDPSCAGLIIRGSLRSGNAGADPAGIPPTAGVKEPAKRSIGSDSLATGAFWCPQ
jgi:hypothetical protein